MIKFSYSILYVKDVTKQVEFYERAFGFERKFISPDSDYGELATGEVSLAFASVQLAQTNIPGGFIQSDAGSKPFPMEIGFTTADVEGAVKKAVRAGATPVSDAKAKPWGQTVAYIRDPEGFLVELCTPMPT